VRVLSTSHGRKADAGDAVSIAVAALGATRLHQVGVEDQITVLRLLSDRRDDLAWARTQTVNRLHRLFTDLVPAGAGQHLTADAAAALLRRVRPTGPALQARRQLAADLVGDVQLLDRRIAAVEERIRSAVHESKTTLVELFGVGPVLARLLGEVGDIRRFSTKACFAVHNGTAPLEARSSTTGCLGPGTASSSCAVSHGDRPDPPSDRWPGRLPTQAGRGQIPSGSAAVPQAPVVRCHLSVSGHRSAEQRRGCIVSLI
jgi:transposase